MRGGSLRRQAGWGGQLLDGLAHEQSFLQPPVYYAAPLWGACLYFQWLCQPANGSAVWLLRQPITGLLLGLWETSHHLTTPYPPPPPTHLTHSHTLTFSHTHTHSFSAQCRHLQKNLQGDKRSVRIWFSLEFSSLSLLQGTFVQDNPLGDKGTSQGLHPSFT